MFIDDRDDLDRLPVSGGVELEIHRPHPTGCISDHGVRRGGSAVAFASSALRHSKFFFAPQPLRLLVIQVPSFTAGIVIRGPKTSPEMVFGVSARPDPQSGVGIGGGGCAAFVALRGAMLPGHPAAAPFPNPQRPPESTNGRSPGVPGLEDSPRDLLERSLLRLGISQQPLMDRVLAFEVLHLLASSAFRPPNWLRER